METPQEAFDRAHDHAMDLADAASKIKEIRFERQERARYGDINPAEFLIEIFILIYHFARAGYHAARATGISDDEHIAMHVKEYRDEIPGRGTKLWYAVGTVVGKLANVTIG